jgi:hypothetical protein
VPSRGAGGACRAAKKAGVPEPEIQRFVAEAIGGDHDHLLATCLRWFELRRAARP